jgi:hypothetical protein
VSENTRNWMHRAVKEIQKHADRDGCYSCKQLLKSALPQAVIAAEKERNKQ